MARPIVPTLCVPAPLAIAVAVGQPAVRGALALGHPGELGHLGLHECFREHPDAFPEEVDVSVRARLAEQLEHGHPVLGHR